MLKIFTDTDTDILPEDAKKYGYKVISMPYIVNGEEIKPYEDFEVFEYAEFYNRLRKGLLPKTCAISSEEYKRYFEEDFKQGNEILYVHFSRAMSGTFNAMEIAVKELKEKYPNAKFYTVDTKGITILSNIIVKEIGDLYLEGKGIEEILKWAEENVDKYATYFFADSLSFFAKSGRISNFSKVMGTLIGIKPIIYMDAKGTMTNIGKERGRIKAMNKLISYFDELVVEPTKHRIVIGHADALDMAKDLGNKLNEKYNNELNIEYVVVNPTAGSHCGPDTIGIAFFAKHK